MASQTIALKEDKMGDEQIRIPARMRHRAYEFDAAVQCRLAACSMVWYARRCRTVLRSNRHWPLAAVLLAQPTGWSLACLPHSNTAGEQSLMRCCCHWKQYELRSLSKVKDLSLDCMRLMVTVACLSMREPSVRLRYEIDLLSLANVEHEGGGSKRTSSAAQLQS